jgi:uracil-DNA glycosylase family 4
MAERSDLLRQIRDELIAATDAPLYAYRTANGYYPVAGMGNHYAKIMFVGEAPGENEAKQGRPFVGAAGRFLDELLASIQLKREDVYITNIVKDRPPDNRDPSREEIAYYAPFLIRQINIIQPQVIATLGRFSMTWLLTHYNSPDQHRKISELHGKVIPLNVDYGQISLVALYHPAQALYKAADRPIHFADFKVLEAFK